MAAGRRIRCARRIARRSRESAQVRLPEALVGHRAGATRVECSILTRDALTIAAK